MTLVWLIALPLAGGVLSWLLARANATASRVVALLAMLGHLALVATLWRTPPTSSWLMSFSVPWLPQLGIDFRLGLDGLSLLLVALTSFLGLVSIAISWREVTARVGFYHLNLLWVLAGVTGVFLALDLFLFYFFWELMLIPMFLLILIWGHEDRRRAAIKFFLFTQLSGLLMLVSILALFFLHWQQTGLATFDVTQLLGTDMPSTVAVWLMLGFLAAFAVKLPVIPFHTWLPDAHTQAPTAGSVILAGLLLKTGGYGLLRFAIPLFPQAVPLVAGPCLIIAVAGIIYGGVMAFAQRDVKRLVAYTSVSHLGFVFLAAFIGNEAARQGAVMQMLAHGVTTGALFVLVGLLQDRLGTRDLDRMGGLWRLAPKLGGALLFFSLAAVGVPGLGNFVGEFLVLLGAFQQSPAFAIIAAAGLIVAIVYGLWLVQRVLYGEPREPLALRDLAPHELAVIAALALAILWLGLAPMTFLRFTAAWAAGGAP